MRMCGSKVQLSTYINVDLFQKIEEERKKTGESQSGLICSVLEAYYANGNREIVNGNT